MSDETFGLDRILQAIQNAEQSGTLKIQKDEKEVNIIFNAGLIRMAVFSYKPSVLLESLMYCHDIEREVVEALLTKQRASKKPLFAFLKEAELPDPRLKDENFLTSLCTTQISENLYDLFSWANIHCEFTENSFSPHLVEKELMDLPIAINPESISMEAAKRHDELRDILEVKKTITSYHDIPILSHNDHSTSQIANATESEVDQKVKITTLVTGWTEFSEVLKPTQYSVEQAIALLTKAYRNRIISGESTKECKKILQVVSALDVHKNLLIILAKLKLSYELFLHIIYLLWQQDRISIHSRAEILKVVHILQLLNGVRDFEEILEQARMSAFTLITICSSLIEAKIIQLRKAEELLQLVELEIVREDTKKSIRIYERVEMLGHKNFNTVKWLANAYESSGLTSKSVEKYLELGLLSMESAQYSEAVRAFRKVIEFAADDRVQLEAYERLISAYNKWGRRDKAAEVSAKYARKVAVSDKRKAIMVLETANNNYPSSPTNLELLASLYLEMGDKDNAILTYGVLANLMKKQDDQDGGLNAYQRILAIDPGNVQAHLELAKGYIGIGKIPEGVQQYKILGQLLNQFLQESKDNPAMTASLGSVAEILRDVCKAILEHEKENVEVHEWLVDTYMFMGDLKNSLNILRILLNLLQKDEAYVDKLELNLRKAIVLDTDDFKSRKALADLFLRRKKRTHAIQEYMQLGMRCLEKNDPRRARDAFDAVIAMDPFNITARQKRSEILHALNMQAKAVEEFRLVAYLTKAVGMVPEAIEALGHIVRSMGDKEIGCLEEMAQLYESLGEIQKAIEYHKNYAIKSMSHSNFGEVQQACIRILNLDPNDAIVLRWKKLAEQKQLLVQKFMSERR